MKTMQRIVPYTLAALTAGYAGVSLAAIDKDQAIEMAQKESPGEVIKAYQETKKGKQVWEVQIAGQDGKKYEYYYDVENGDLVKKEVDDD